jgi:hypothetical protein
MKALNLDVLAKEHRTVTVGGEVYPIIEMTVENFIETSKQEQKINEKSSDVERVEGYIGMISRSIPSMEMKTLRSLPMEHLAVLMQFINGVYKPEEESEEITDIEEVTPKKGGKKAGKA